MEAYLFLTSNKADDMAHDKLQDFLLKQGSNPQKSVRTFVTGLVLFMISIGLLYLGIGTHHYVQIVALMILVIALALSVKGYVGIISNRIAFFRHQAHKNRQKYKNTK